MRTQRGYVLEASLRILILDHKASEGGQALSRLRKPIGKLFNVYKGFAKLLLEFHSPDLRFVKKFTRPDFWANNFTHLKLANFD